MSGMASGGRVLHHLANCLDDPRNSVVLVGFQAAGTRPQPAERRHGSEDARPPRPRARRGGQRPAFSVHADADESTAQAARRAAAAAHHLRRPRRAAGRRRPGGGHRRTPGWTAVIPRYLETVRLD
ncbi:MAG: hypothetical protein U0802_21740 [Candidatus Binatia bacterium]